MFIFPNTFVLCVGHLQYKINICWISPNKLLNILLDSQSAIHFLESFIWPPTKILFKRIIRVDCTSITFIFFTKINQTNGHFLIKIKCCNRMCVFKLKLTYFCLCTRSISSENDRSVSHLHF